MRSGRVLWAWGLLASTCVVAAACGGDVDTSTSSCPEGTERCPCYGNDTCDQGLTCASDLCVATSPEVDAGGGDSGGTGGTGGGFGTLDGGTITLGGSGGRAGGGGAGGDGTGGDVGGGSGGLTGGIGGISGRGGGGGIILRGGSGGLSGGGSGGIGGECVPVAEPARLTTVNLIFMFDKSGSMGPPMGPPGPAEPWTSVSEGLLAFFEDPGTTQLNASLEFFPVYGPLETACDVAQYETPMVPLTSLDEAAGSAPFIAAIERTTPGGGTTTLPALQGAINYATEVALADPSARTVVVFVTDGEPGFWIDPPGEVQPGCTNNDIDHAAAVARAAFEGSPRIVTYVIAIGPSLDALAPIATAGGTALIYVPVGNPDQTKTTFQQELAAIRTLNLSCDVPIPEPPRGEQLDPTVVNVRFIDSYGVNPIGRADGCPAGIGWQYSEFDNQGLPTVIELCPNTCAAVQGDTTGQLEVQFGCATVLW